ncbi:hypothetical protein M8C21_019094 [Ambrosia artemisiifolia]|uniref:Aminotransferase class I/classII large domain-containing protein n=1 Tax=Ambrosia artemisiifolia TaxID=4212 RepID=A0AAD5GP87_AMBAR|nr:hypothetical protein M8C21_019094 [Ambrosia artemisiifolia]
MGIENGSTLKKKWGFLKNKETNMVPDITIRGVRYMLMSKLNKSDTRPVLPLAHGDPSAFACFRTTQIAEDALVNSIRSGNFNGYGPGVGIPQARRAVADYLSQDLPNKLSEEDVFLTVGCAHAIQTIITVVANPNANILLPKPGFPYYEAVAKSCHLEVRHFELLPEKDWEVDLDAVEALADENTLAMVIINPGNPCGNIFTRKHLEKVKLDLFAFEDIKDDLDFCLKLAKEESVIILPGITVGLKNWLRITYAIEPSALEDGIKRLKAFCERHSNKE